MRTILVALFTLCAGAATASESLSLSPNAVLGADRTALYVSAPDLSLRAYGVGDGKPLWSTAIPGRPLAEINGRLITLGAPPQAGVARFQVLNADTGALISKVDAVLGAPMRAEVAPQPGSSFAVTAEAMADDHLRIHWRYEARPLRGALLAENDDHSEYVETAGTVDLILAGDQTQVQLREAMSAPVFLPRVAAEKQKTKLSPQFRARDDAHVMISREVSDPVFGVRYQWEVYARGESERLGTATALLPYSSFAVTGSTLLMQALPYSTHSAEGELSVGEHIIGIQLGSGAERWRIAVLNSRYEGPLPP